MRGYVQWNHRPYLPPDKQDKVNSPYICRLIPHRNGAEAALAGSTDGVKLFWRKLWDEQGKWESIKAESPYTVLDGLEENSEYIIYAEDKNGNRSCERKLLTGDIPWTAVNYLHPKDGQYEFSGQFLCSPSIVRLKSGGLLISCDLYAQMAPQNLTLIFRSDDDGNSWSYVTELMPCFWGKLFVHKDALYMLAMSTEYGDLLIGKSTDEGKTWSEPKVLLRGAGCTGRGWHRAPCTILRTGGRMYTSLEYGAWGKGGFASAVLSVSEDADLMNPESWTVSELWNDSEIDAIEGNLVCSPDGEILNILRYKSNEAIVLKASADGERLTYYKTVKLPAAHTKFEIQQKNDGTYVAVGNNPPMRNVLSVYTSSDLESWQLHSDVIDGRKYDSQSTGFQYPSFIIEGDKLLIVSRTAFHGADSFHNNNYITFHKAEINTSEL